MRSCFQNVGMAVLCFHSDGSQWGAARLVIASRYGGALLLPVQCGSWNTWEVWELLVCSRDFKMIAQPLSSPAPWLEERMFSELRKSCRGALGKGL